MRKITQEELNKILENHARWLSSNPRYTDDENRAYLNEVDLSNISLRGINLRGSRTWWSIL